MKSASRNSSPAPNSRATAARIVATWLTEGQFPDRMLEADIADRAFVTELVLGVVRRHRSLEWLRASLVPRRPVTAIDACLMVGLYQLLFLDDVQPYAAVNETVEAAKSVGGAKAASLVNAVLRRAQSGRSAFFQSLEKQPLGIRCSHPDFLVGRWTRQFGAANAARLCEWNNRTPDVVVRIIDSVAAVSDRRSDNAPIRYDPRRPEVAATERKKRLIAIGAGPHAFDPMRFFVLPHGARITELPGFREGWFTVQDPATSVATDLLGAKPGERVLDACAAPGGKTIALAEAMQGRGELVAADSSAHRLKILRENLARTQFDGFVNVTEGAASGTFDAILLDVPCTNTGVIRRRPDARWRFTPERLDDAARQQKAILDDATKLVAPVGRIVYSTCSLEPEENEEQLRAWLAQHADFRLAEERRLFPPDSQTDGAYAALLVRG